MSKRYPSDVVKTSGGWRVFEGGPVRWREIVDLGEVQLLDYDRRYALQVDGVVRPVHPGHLYTHPDGQVWFADPTTGWQEVSLKCSPSEDPQ